jgi:hypothetical protein
MDTTHEHALSPDGNCRDGCHIEQHFGKNPSVYSSQLQCKKRDKDKVKQWDAMCVEVLIQLYSVFLTIELIAMEFVHDIMSKVLGVHLHRRHSIATLQCSFSPDLRVHYCTVLWGVNNSSVLYCTALHCTVVPLPSRPSESE